MKAEMGMMFYMPWDVSDGQQPQKLGEGHQIDSFSQLLEVPNLAPHWDSNLQNCESIAFCCLNHWVCYRGLVRWKTSPSLSLTPPDSPYRSLCSSSNSCVLFLICCLEFMIVIGVDVSSILATPLLPKVGSPWASFLNFLSLCLAACKPILFTPESSPGSPIPC